MKYFDPIKQQLIYIKNKADSDYWDAHWDLDENIRMKILGTKNTFVSRITKKYLKPSDGYILEGGCGNGVNVASLYSNGYKVIGIDYAENTVKTLNKYIPELDIRLGDVRNLPFEDDYFIGYWSLGVIEHFCEGYGSIALEMFRVLKDSGYLFLAFPYMSPLRCFKGRFGKYELWKKEMKYDSFYQFALNSETVIQHFRDIGFKLIRGLPFDGIKGTKDEVAILKPVLQKLYDYNSSMLAFKGFRKAISIIMSTVAGHCMLLIFKKSSV
ncbi:MAG: class I SAM-dependent methyltransferase [Nitrospirota bacterium]